MKVLTMRSSGLDRVSSIVQSLNSLSMLPGPSLWSSLCLLINPIKSLSLIQSFPSEPWILLCGSRLLEAVLTRPVILTLFDLLPENIERNILEIQNVCKSSNIFLTMTCSFFCPRQQTSDSSWKSDHVWLYFSSCSFLTSSWLEFFLLLSQDQTTRGPQSLRYHGVWPDPTGREPPSSQCSVIKSLEHFSTCTSVLL